MPNYYSDGGMDWYDLSDDSSKASSEVSAIKALSSPTYAQVIAVIAKPQSKPKTAFTKK